MDRLSGASEIALINALMCSVAVATLVRPIGDADCDGTVNAVDAALVLQFGAGLLSSLLCQQNGDVNHDGSITLSMQR